MSDRVLAAERRRLLARQLVRDGGIKVGQTARRFGVVDSYDATQNIRGGVQYLAWLLKRFNGDLTLAAAGYNAGEGAVDRHKGVPPYSETQRYVQRVGVLVERYRSALNPVAASLRGGLSAR